jgi:pyruvate-formate lyase-activating enzyme
MTGHKTLEALKEEVDFFIQWRNPDNFSIAGGEPLIYPQIVELVEYIARKGIKPVILTNAYALNPEILKKLKKAGLAGFTIHIDSHQNRPHWNGKTEAELNELRQKCADMIAAEGGMYLIFNSTTYPSTFKEIPDIVRWGQANIDKVNGLVFITYRTATSDSNVAIDSRDQKVDMSKLSYVQESFGEKFVTSPEVYELIQQNFPEYDAAGYLGGSVRHDTFKWLIGALVGSKNQVYGSVGKRTMELSQAGHHFFTGRYLAYLAEAAIGGKIFLLSPWDGTLRAAWKKQLGKILRHPGRLFEKIYVQSIGIIQAPDILPDGRADMCDSCPDVTIYEGKFINSCRMDEYRLFGGFVAVVDKDKVNTPAEN